ncbi:phytase [Massilia sp. IC2-476]|uniref:phytase n=1 Tax=Massilia sp. IC2-476 TaxID=2887199 RepID=UPI001D12F78A|nr:phytase [Massilia sp. IC2-476]MCC2970746.1 phytase [Massilia sp. IC2-476]
MKRTFIPAALALLLAALPAMAAEPPPSLRDAEELAPLPNGAWLALDKRALRLVDADGRERASLPLRGEGLDLRPLDGGALAIVVDSNAERLQPVRVDTRAGTLAALAALPDTGFGIEAACLFRDAQGLDHVFLVAKDGQAQQWLLGGEYRLVRRLALPTGVEHCRVDDAHATLFVAEEALGVWAYGAEAEGPPTRTPVALRAPWGALKDGVAALAVLPGGLAAVDDKGALLSWRRAGANWQPLPARRLRAQGLASGAGASASLLVRTGKGWQAPVLGWKAGTPAAPTLPVVLPRMQTEPVARAGDAADDPAIWVHPTDPSRSRILGTNKKQGLLVYDLQGRQVQLLESGRLNNVDLRQDVRFGTERFDLALATQRDENAMVLFTIDAEGGLREAARLPTGLDDIYGACVLRTPEGGMDAFVNDKDGRYEHYRITRSAGRFGARLARSFRLASQPEGCVADDRSGLLFVGEERRGVWVTSARADQPASLKMVMPVGPLLHADVEGMGIYHGSKRSYLVVSSQGNNSYVVLDAAAPFAVRGAFRIGMDAVKGIDGASETDGLEVSSANLGGAYGRGMLVVQDGFKRLPDGAQNFKAVAWNDIAAALGLDDGAR